jgi:hypothetical protein
MPPQLPGDLRVGLTACDPHRDLDPIRSSIESRNPESERRLCARRTACFRALYAVSVEHPNSSAITRGDTPTASRSSTTRRNSAVNNRYTRPDPRLAIQTSDHRTPTNIVLR